MKVKVNYMEQLKGLSMEKELIKLFMNYAFPSKAYLTFKDLNR